MIYDWVRCVSKEARIPADLLYLFPKQLRPDLARKSKTSSSAMLTACNRIRPTNSGFNMTVSHGGQFRIIHLTGVKCLNTTAVGRVAIIASMIGALNPGSFMASTDRAKQNEVIMSIVKHRKPKKRSEDTPALDWALKAAQSALIY